MGETMPEPAIKMAMQKWWTSWISLILDASMHFYDGYLGSAAGSGFSWRFFLLDDDLLSLLHVLLLQLHQFSLDLLSLHL